MMQVYACTCLRTHLARPLFSVLLGCFHDDVRTEPGSWLVLA
jgi:hypothetical protein